MLTSLEMVNYRGFEHYKVSGLSRVNLLVGGNNSGKTSILEAVRLVASGGDVAVLATIALQRGEVLPGPEDGDRRPLYPDVSHFFHGREFQPGSSFTLRSEPGNKDVVVSIESADDLPENERFPFYALAGARLGMPFALKVKTQGVSKDRSVIPLPVSVEGGIPPDLISRFSPSLKGRKDGGVVQFLAQDSLDRVEMGEIWDEVVAAGEERDVLDAMRILEPKLSSIAFLGGGRTYGLGSRGGIVLGFEGIKRRHPLGSQGEAMRRMLALSLSLARARNGVLLIDEIDTGFHYSIMGDVWLLIAETARRHDIQVFATTHSLDCVRGLDWLCLHHPDLGLEASLQKIVPVLNQAVAFDAKEIQIAADLELEVR